MRHLAGPWNAPRAPHIVVLGDVILDRYTWGDAERVSPEAPVLVLRADDEEARLGGAASVALLLRSLGAQVRLAGVIGDDGSGRVVSRLLDDAGIDAAAVLRVAGRPTTTKERFLGRGVSCPPAQVLRVDREVCQPIAPAVEDELVESALRCLQDHQALLVSDYAKGACTPGLLRRLIVAARVLDVPVFIDPARVADYGPYRGANLLLPNRREAELATGCRIGGPEEALAAGKELRLRYDVGGVLVKLDRDGLVLDLSDGEGQWFPTRPRAVCDVTGAGDMVLAAVAFCRAAGAGWEESVRLANVAAGLAVERIGVVPVSWPEIVAELSRGKGSERGKVVSLEQAEALAEGYRRGRRRLVFTNGCFDLLHVGHLRCLQQAAELGDVLFVAVNGDQSVRRLKGPGRPVVGESERAALVAALACVDHVLVFEEDTPLEPLQRLRPDVLVKGGTYSVEEVVGRGLVESYGGRVCVTGEVANMSTTRLLGQLRQGRAVGATSPA